MLINIRQHNKDTLQIIGKYFMYNRTMNEDNKWSCDMIGICSQRIETQWEDKDESL